jgi:hypothetical protein
VVVAHFDAVHVRLSLAMEGSVNVPVTDPTGIRTQLFAFSPMICAHKDLLSATKVIWGALGCAVGMAGALLGSWQDVTHHLAYGAVGGRAGTEVSNAAGAALRAQVEVLPAVHSARFLEARPGVSAGTGSTAVNAAIAFVFAL